MVNESPLSFDLGDLFFFLSFFPSTLYLSVLYIKCLESSLSFLCEDHRTISKDELK